ncbi:MAG TPA: hypothetical protein VGJ33_12355 [Candidatus Angelobacter sp.]|jgi:hypothetical protein
MADTSVTNANVLNSWKEVATYMGRGVRTVQRWEQELGLPVRRPRGKSRSAVIALKPELDSWLAKAGKEETRKKTGTAAHLHSNTAVLASQTHQLVSRSHVLCERSKRLCEQINRAIMLSSQLSARRNSNNLATLEPPQQLRALAS